jgi:hypothetical protein
MARLSLSREDRLRLAVEVSLWCPDPGVGKRRVHQPQGRLERLGHATASTALDTWSHPIPVQEEAAELITGLAPAENRSMSFACLAAPVSPRAG